MSRRAPPSPRSHDARRAGATPVPAAAVVALAAVVSSIGCGGGGGATPAPPAGHVIQIDIDDHGLAGLWMANAPNIQGLIARGTLAYSRVLVPTHSNQNNMALLTGQYPDGHDVPSNAWLARAHDFEPPVNLPGLGAGDYALYASNPLRVRGDSVYQATRRAGGTSAYVGQLPPFEMGADDVHLAMVGLSFSGVTITPSIAAALLVGGLGLGYPQKLVDTYVFDGPPAPGETPAHFTLHDAAQVVRATSAAHPMPQYMFVWDFLALDGDPTSVSGASGPDLIAAIEDYDAGLGDLLSALEDKGRLDDTNILFTLDHGKVDAIRQVVLGTRGGHGSMPADGQLGALVTAMGGAVGVTTDDYEILNEDGDALVYARVDGAGTAAGADRQATVAHALLSLIQSGAITGLDTTRTMTADGAMGTRRFQDFHASSPNQADILVFPADGWTLNQVDGTNSAPGPFQQHTAFPYGRHGGFSVDELYVPLIMAGPAFKSGVVLPHPVEHPQVAATALAVLGDTRLRTGERGPILAALAGDPGETLPLPDPAAVTRDTILAMSGYEGTVALPAAPAGAAVIIDVAGLYEEEIFSDPMLSEAAGPLAALAARGVCFEDLWTDSRDWPVTEFQFLAGGLPTASVGPITAEDDPTQTLPPGAGLLQMPPANGFIANQGAFSAWRQPTVLAGDTLFDAAKRLGMTTAVIGQPDFHALHVAAASIDVQRPTDLAGAAGALRDLLAQQPRLLAIVALGGARTGDRHAPAAIAELGALTAAVADVAAAAGDALVVITSRGATTIDDPRADFYGAGTSHHVPLVLVGPNVRVGAVSGQPGSPSDLPATVLVALGAATATDFVTGTWAAGAPVGGVPQPSPSGATAGRALMRAFVGVPTP